MVSEPVLFDTNILVFSHNTDSPYYKKAAKLREEAILGRLKAVLTHQNLLEFYAIITDPRRVTHPLTPIQALAEVAKYIAHDAFRVISPTSEALELFRKFSKRVKARGGEIFDVYLVATMVSSKVKTIYTGNERDFQKYDFLRVINPFRGREK